MILTKQEIREAFINSNLEEEYNFLEDDLVKLANAFIEKAKPSIVKEERDLCIDVVRSLNTLVSDKLAEIRGNA
jgi:hypothetical protein